MSHFWARIIAYGLGGILLVSTIVFAWIRS